MGFLHEHIILPLSDLLKGESVHKYLRLLREAESWSDEHMKEFQQQRLHQLLVYASQEVPFYRDWIQTHDLNPNFLTLDQMPIVSKAIMRKEGIDRFSAENFPVKKRIPSRSSGSTGEPFTFYETKSSYSINMAAKLRTWYQAGYHLGDRYMKITNGIRNSKIKRLQDALNNCIYIPFYSINDDTLITILSHIEHTKPLIIRSYPIPLYLLAQYRNTHRDNYQHQPLHVMTTGSTLPDAYRTEIEKAFGCDVIDSYSCEGTPNTYETTNHDRYHVTEYYGIIEVLDEKNEPITNGIGRVVSTDLWNLAHPFIRYDTQDLVEVNDGKISRITGRQCETLIKADGKLLTVHNFTHFFSENYPSVDGWQVVKQKDGNIRFNLVTNNLFTTHDEKCIKQYWSDCLGCQINIGLVERLPLMSNNKHLSIIDE